MMISRFTSACYAPAQQNFGAKLSDNPSIYLKKTYSTEEEFKKELEKLKVPPSDCYISISS